MPDEATMDETTPAAAGAGSVAEGEARQTDRPEGVARQDDRTEGEARQNNRKVRDGVVVSDRMDKTAIVVITSRVRHPRYKKILQHHKKLYVHDPENDLHVGDRVRVQETRPTSKLKRWRMVEVLERAR